MTLSFLGCGFLKKMQNIENKRLSTAAPKTSLHKTENFIKICVI